MIEDGSTPDWRVDTAHWPGPDQHDPFEEPGRVMLQLGRAYGRSAEQAAAGLRALAEAYGVAAKDIHFHGVHHAQPEPSPKENALRWKTQPNRSYPTSKPPWQRRRR